VTGSVRYDHAAAVTMPGPGVVLVFRVGTRDEAYNGPTTATV